MVCPRFVTQPLEFNDLKTSSRRNLLWLAACIFSVCAALGTVPANAAVNSPPKPRFASDPGYEPEHIDAYSRNGELNVGLGGNAKYSLPLIVAAGTSGFAPSINLTYSSAVASNSVLGVGWRMGGLQAVTRCKKNAKMDDINLPISWNGDDRYCLNGERLLVVSDKYGTDKSTYKPRVDNGSNTTLVGGVIGKPNYFKVEQKNGDTLYFGSRVDAKKDLGGNRVISWKLSQRKDVAGNTINYYYNADANLDRIEYAYGHGSVAQAVVRFTYEGRDDVIRSYYGGTLMVVDKRLVKISAYNSGVTLREYHLHYDSYQSKLQHDVTSRLTSVEECVDDVCANPIVFEWAKPKALADIEYTVITKVAGVSGAGEVDIYKFSAFGDINGDGLKDFVYSNYGQIFIYELGTIDRDNNFSFKRADDVVFPGGGGVSSMHLRDFNMDGRDDVIFAKYNKETWVYLSIPQDDGTWKISKDKIVLGVFAPDALKGRWRHKLLIDDINDDGGLDFIYWARSHDEYATGAGIIGQSLRLRPHVNTPYERYHTGTLKQVFPAGHSPASCDSGYSDITDPRKRPIFDLRSQRGDFNGDGITDYVATVNVNCFKNSTGDAWTGNHRSNMSNQIYLTKKDDWNEYSLEYFGGLGDYSEASDMFYDAKGINSVYVADLNRDGLSDIVYNKEKNGREWFYKFSDGKRFTKERPLPFDLPTHRSSRWFVSVYDVNGDTYPDVIYDSGSEGVRVLFWDPKNNRFGHSTSLGLPGSGGGRGSRTFSDLNNDGIIDYTSYRSGNTSVTMLVSKPVVNPENKIVGISSRFAGSTSIEYKLLSHSGRHYDYNKGVNSKSLNRETCNLLARACWKVVTHSQFFNEFYDSIHRNNKSDGGFNKDFNQDNSVYEISPSIYAVTAVAKFALTPVELFHSPLIHRTTHRRSYHYEGMRRTMHRSFAGFRRITQVDEHTGVYTQTKTRYDWPFEGSITDKRVFNSSGDLLDWYINVWAVGHCVDDNNRAKYDCYQALYEDLDYGYASMGPIRVVQPRSVHRSYTQSDGNFKSSVKKVNLYDSKGNLKRRETIISRPFADTLFDRKVTEAYTYDYSGSTWRMTQGLVAKKITTRENQKYDSITNTVDYEYHKAGVAAGELHKEIIEPGGGDLEHVTEFEYNGFGGVEFTRKKASGQVRKTRNVTDSYGRYITEAYEQFLTDTRPTAAAERLVSKVVSFDRSGAPAEVQKYVDATDYVTTKSYYTPFGQLYFVADSTGQWFKNTAGTGAGPQGLCSRYSGTWMQATQSGGASTHKCLDPNGNLMIKASLTEEQWSVVDFAYDLVGRLLRKSEPYFKGEDTPLWTVYQGYDVRGRPAKITHAPKSAGERAPVTLFSYEGLTTVTTVTTNAEDQITTVTTDALGQVVSVKDNLDGVVSYRYDAQGNLRSVTDQAMKQTTLIYDKRGRKIQLVDPDVRTQTYRYNGFGELLCEKNAKGQTVSTVYDIRGRVFSTTERLNNGSSCLQPTGPVEKYTQWQYDLGDNSFGQLYYVFDSKTVGRKDQNYRQFLYYDKFGRLRNSTTIVPGANDVPLLNYEKYTYDQYGRLFQRFDSARLTNAFNNNGVEYKYANNGALKEVLDAEVIGGVNKSYYKVEKRNSRGQVTSAVFGNGVSENTEYYPGTGRIYTSKTHVADAFVLLNTKYNWSLAGKLGSIRERGAGAGLINRNIIEYYDYDDLNRLEEWLMEVDYEEEGSMELRYNETGNITYKSLVGDYKYGSECVNSGAGAHAVCKAGKVNYYYDRNGNLTKDSSGRSVEYNVSSQVVRVSQSGSKAHTVEFDYDPYGGRYRRVDSSGGTKTTTVYSGSVEKTYKPDNTIEWRRHIDGLVIITDKLTAAKSLISSSKHYVHSDHLGSPALLTNEDSIGIQEFYFDPWGKSVNFLDGSKPTSLFALLNNPITSRGYTGHEMLDEVGLIHMNGRVYDPNLARFIQADPFIQSPYNGASLNRYSYLWNNPLGGTDPSGFVGEWGSACKPDGDDCDPDPMEVDVWGELEKADLDGSLAELDYDWGADAPTDDKYSDSDGFTPRSANGNNGSNSSGTSTATVPDISQEIVTVMGVKMTVAESELVVDILEAVMAGADVVDTMGTGVMFAGLSAGGVGAIPGAVLKAVMKASKWVGKRALKSVVKSVRGQVSALRSRAVTKSAKNSSGNLTDAAKAARTQRHGTPSLTQHARERMAGSRGDGQSVSSSRVQEALDSGTITKTRGPVVNRKISASDSASGRGLQVSQDVRTNNVITVIDKGSKR